VVYLVRYASAQQQSAVDRDTTLDADVETPQVKDALKQVGVILDIFRCLKSAVAETTAGDGMTVTHWRNEIRDLESR
jgi:myo-inositol-1-phosphate synthase